MTSPQRLRVGIVGFGWMGQVHARAVAAYGFETTYADWRDLLARDDLDLVSVTGPNSVHRDVDLSDQRRRRPG